MRFQNRSPRVRRNNTRALLNAFILCLIIAGLWFICLNIAPYVKFVTILSRQIFKFDSNLISQGMLLLFGICFWAILQFLQLFPLLLYSSGSFMKSLIRTADNRQRATIKDTDEPVVVRIKTTYNALPVSFVSNLENLCVISYLIDVSVNCIINSPIKGGLQRLGDVYMYGRFDLISWGNLFLNLQTVFAVELIVLMLLWTFSLLAAMQPEE